eukprot:gene5098-7107_t
MSRPIAQNAKGSKRRITKSKRSSLASDDDERDENGKVIPQRPKKSKLNQDDELDKINDLNMISQEDVIPGAKSYFRTLKGTNSQGIRNNIKKYENHHEWLVPVEDIPYLHSFEQKYRKFDNIDQDLTDRYIDSNGRQWLWSLITGLNLLLYGVGSKNKLLKKFATRFLNNEDVIYVEGSTDDDNNATTRPNKTIKSLLDLITTNVLHQKDLNSRGTNLVYYCQYLTDLIDSHYGRGKNTKYHKYHSMSDKMDGSGESEIIENSTTGYYMNTEVSMENQSFDAKLDYSTNESIMYNDKKLRTNKSSSDILLEWGGRYAHAQTKLFIVINDISGSSLSSNESQLCLSILASCASVSIICTMEHLNMPLLWTSSMVQSFNWSFQHVPTYSNDCLLPQNFSMVLTDKPNYEISEANRALDYVLRSLTPKHHEVLQILCDYHCKKLDEIENKKTANQNSKQTKKTKSNKEAVIVDDYDGFISMVDLFQICLRRCVSINNSELYSLVREFIDHQIIIMKSDSNKVDFIRLNLSDSTIRTLIAETSV